MEHVSRSWQLCHNYVQDNQNYIKNKKRDRKRGEKKKKNKKKPN